MTEVVRLRRQGSIRAFPMALRVRGLQRRSADGLSYAIYTHPPLIKVSIERTTDDDLFRWC